MEHEGDGDTNCNQSIWDNPQWIGKGTGKLEDMRTSGDYPDDSIIKIGQNIEKTSRDLRRLAPTQTLVKDHELTVV